MINITLKPNKVTFLFLLIVFFLTFVHCIISVLFFYFDENPNILTLVEWFDLDLEDNIPSLYSAFAILICSSLFFIIASYKPKPFDYEKLCWFGLGIIFFFLAIDETFQVHEAIGDITEDYVDATGFLYFPWVIPYGFAVIVFILFYLKYLLGLPKKTAILFILSGVIYLTGAVILDMLGGREAELHGYESVAYYILYTVEEFFEMIAIVILIYALFAYIEQQFGYLNIILQIQPLNR